MIQYQREDGPIKRAKILTYPKGHRYYAEGNEHFKKDIPFGYYDNSRMQLLSMSAHVAR